MKETNSTGKEGAGEPKIYNRVKVLRVERGLSRKKLAERLKVNYQTVGYIERGEYNPSLELAFRISSFFGLPIEAIFSRSPLRPLSEEMYGLDRGPIARSREEPWREGLINE